MVLYDLDKEKLTCRQCNTPYELPSYYCPKCQCWVAVYCPGCGESVGGRTWVCKECHFYVHKSCADPWPPEIHHPFHPLHPLKLHYRSSDFEYISKHTCSACKSSTRRFAHHCTECPFGLCLQCVSTNPKTKLEDGNHLLYLFQDTKFERHCDVCDNTDCYAWIFICMVPNCGYAAHIHSTSLAFPAQVQHRRNPHPLVLTRDVVGEDGTDEYYCDSCEDRRDLKHPI
ncbi:O-fucosyltransferase family protein [Psidium guajava]|nr:O-fucosyltransferase family protein [Psidium guajava]